MFTSLSVSSGVPRTLRCAYISCLLVIRGHFSWPAAQSEGLSRLGASPVRSLSLPNHVCLQDFLRYSTEVPLKECGVQYQHTEEYSRGKKKNKVKVSPVSYLSPSHGKLCRDLPGYKSPQSKSKMSMSHFTLIFYPKLHDVSDRHIVLFYNPFLRPSWCF